MFTGLIRECAKVRALSLDSLTLEANYKPKIGDSIAVNGACLSAIEILPSGFVLQRTEETQKNSLIQPYNGLVHIEPALQLSDRLDGHLLQGHIDGIGTISAITPHEIGTDFFITLPSHLQIFAIPKGSIAVNGISLTINEVSSQHIRLTLIPHTIQTTLFGFYQVNDQVNIESDMFARMLYHFLQNKSELSWERVDEILGSY